MKAQRKQSDNKTSVAKAQQALKHVETSVKTLRRMGLLAVDIKEICCDHAFQCIWFMLLWASKLSSILQLHSLPTFRNLHWNLSVLTFRTLWWKQCCGFPRIFSTCCMWLSTKPKWISCTAFRQHNESNHNFTNFHRSCSLFHCHVSLRSSRFASLSWLIHDSDHTNNSL